MNEPTIKESQIVDVNFGKNVAIIKIVDNVVIGAGAVVTKDILKAGIYAGNPARLIREL